MPLRDDSGETVAQLKVSVRRDAFAAALDEIDAITVGAFLLALLLAAVIGLVVAQTISKPLRRLAAAATAIAHGDLHQELPTQRHDEIGSLAQAFNTMSAHVAARIDGLSEKTQTLALEISNLSAFGATLAQTPDPHAELRRLADMIRAMLDADTASVFLVYEGHTTRAAFSGGQRCPVPSPAADELAAWAVRYGTRPRGARRGDRRAPERAGARHQPAAQLPRGAARAPGGRGRAPSPSASATPMSSGPRSSRCSPPSAARSRSRCRTPRPTRSSTACTSRP